MLTFVFCALICILSAQEKINLLTKKYKEFSDAAGLPYKTERMSVTKFHRVKTAAELKRNQLRIGGSIQKFDASVLGGDEKVQVNRHGYTVSVAPIVSSPNHLYVSHKVKWSKQELKTVEANISASKKVLGLPEGAELPKMIAVDTSEKPNERVAAFFDATTNTLVFDSKLASSELLPLLQTGTVLPEDGRSTFVHELIHWKRAQDYIKEHGPITESNYSNYIARMNEISKTELDKAFKDVYTYRGISAYAEKQGLWGRYDEVYTEYLTKILLGG